MMGYWRIRPKAKAVSESQISGPHNSEQVRLIVCSIIESQLQDPLGIELDVFTQSIEKRILVSVGVD